MPSRSERHEKMQPVRKRVSKNQGLYEDLKRYTNYVEVSNIESVIEKENFDLNEITQKRRRSESTSRPTQSAETFSSLFMMDEPKEHDINKILTEAKQTRIVPDTELELEEKRKLKKEEYNITNKVDIHKIEEMKLRQKDHSADEKVRQELSEMIDTIYSKGLKDAIDQKAKDTEEDLFSELLPASNDETLIDENLSKEIIARETKEREERAQQEKEESKKIESSFFTRSTELNPNDLMDEEEDESFIEDKPLPIWAVILIAVAIIAVVGFAGFWIYKSVI